MTKHNPYKKFDDIPIHCFSNKELTKTPSPELRTYLRYMLNNHPDDLAYLWRYCQRYKDVGGCYILTWENWKRKLTNDLAKQP